MVDPVRTLVGALERELAAVPGAELYPGAGSDAEARFQAAFGEPPPPGLGVFRGSHDGGRLGEDIELLALWESTSRHRTLTGRGQGGLRPILRRGPRLFALAAAGASADGEWPVVEVSDHSVDRVGTSLLRFLHVLAAELVAAGSAAEGDEATVPAAVASRSASDDDAAAGV